MTEHIVILWVALTTGFMMSETLERSKKQW
jgi:hypothetical protein